MFQGTSGPGVTLGTFFGIWGRQPLSLPRHGPRGTNIGPVMPAVVYGELAHTGSFKVG